MAIDGEVAQALFFFALHVLLLLCSSCSSSSLFFVLLLLCSSCSSSSFLEFFLKLCLHPRVCHESSPLRESIDFISHYQSIYTRICYKRSNRYPIWYLNFFISQWGGHDTSEKVQDFVEDLLDYYNSCEEPDSCSSFHLISFDFHIAH